MRITFSAEYDSDEVPTPELRWKNYVLEQKWLVRDDQDPEAPIKVEWRRVPGLSNPREDR